MNVNLETHPIWAEITRLVTEIDAEGLAREHLEACAYRIEGYWDGDEFYEVINLNPALEVTLDNIAFSTTTNGQGKLCLVKLIFLLKADGEEFGQLCLVFNSKMEFSDESWSVDLHSPFVMVLTP